jgi:type I phosphodiesterase/nucleotide pyrophosphatase
VTEPAGHLADLLPSAAALLDVPGYADVLGLGAVPGSGGVRKVVVLLVDGLGWQALREHPTEAPCLADLSVGRPPLAVGFPSTTATSITTLGTGALAGRHGLVGYTFALPGHGVLNTLHWDPAVDPLDVQPLPTVLERAADDGVVVAHVAQRSFEGSGLTRAALRGARSPGAETTGETVQATAEVLAAGERVLAYVYTGDLDNVGHVRGWRSPGWRAQLAHVDLLVRQLVAVLPPDAVLVVTADHGMVDVGRTDRVDFDAEPVLQAGVDLLAGEPRARHVYARDGAADDVLRAWRHRLGETADVLARDEAVAAGWFGEVSPAVRPRIGDVVVAPTGGGAVVATRTHPRESRLVGYHGSTTADEVLVPFLLARRWTGALRRSPGGRA